MTLIKRIPDLYPTCLNVQNSEWLFKVSGWLNEHTILKVIDQRQLVMRHEPYRGKITAITSSDASRKNWPWCFTSRSCVGTWYTQPNSESGIEKQVYHKNIPMEGLEGEDDETSTTTSRSRFLLNMAPAARFTHMILAHDCESGRLLSFLSARSTRWLLYSSGDFSYIISKRCVELFQLISGSNVGCFVRLLYFVACPASDSRYCSTWGGAVTK